MKFAFRLVLLVLTVAAASGCMSLPVSGTSSGSGTRGVPIVQVETAPVPAAATLPAATATAGQPTTEASPAGTTAEQTAEATVTSPATVTAAAVNETPAPAASTAAPTPAAPALEHYQGPNPYRATPMFEVAYDPAVWEYVEDDGSGRQGQLKHRTEAGCAIWLRSGPVDAKPVASVYLAERPWTLVQVQPNIIQYVSSQDDFAWIFGVILPEEWSGRGNSNCQDAAEIVIGTFKVVP